MRGSQSRGLNEIKTFYRNFNISGVCIAGVNDYSSGRSGFVFFFFLILFSVIDRALLERFLHF